MTILNKCDRGFVGYESTSVNWGILLTILLFAPSEVVEEMTMSNQIRFLVAIVFVAFLGGCGSQGTVLMGVDRDAVLSFTEAKTENLLAGMNANDYTFAR